MIKMYSAFTEEIDDIDVAVSEIVEQLDLEKSMMKNSVGIINCYHEFIESGVVKALSEKLPFEIVGITVPCVHLSEQAVTMGLMLNMLTGDDVEFATGVSEPIVDGKLSSSMGKLCADVTSKLKDGVKPSMIMAYGPFVHALKVDGDELVDCISTAFPDVPVFGSFSFTAELDFSKCYVLYNGESYETASVLIAITGDIKPSFFTVSVPEVNILGELATVTSSAGNIIHTINGMPVEDYAVSTGLVEEKGQLDKLYTTPIIAKLDDGTIIVRVCIGGDGEGGAVVGGHVPVGATIGFTLLELPDIVSTSTEIAKKSIEISEGKSVIVYSCMARLEFLGMHQRDTEAKAICDVFGDNVNFCLAYVGGEIFPHLLEGGKYINHLQNYSLVVCVM
jgi:hypothetical protein